MLPSSFTWFYNNHGSEARLFIISSARSWDKGLVHVSFFRLDIRDLAHSQCHHKICSTFSPPDSELTWVLNSDFRTIKRAAGSELNMGRTINDYPLSLRYGRRLKEAHPEDTLEQRALKIRDVMMVNFRAMMYCQL